MLHDVGTGKLKELDREDARKFRSVPKGCTVYKYKFGLVERGLQIVHGH